MNTCPYDRRVFHLIFARHTPGGPIYDKIAVADRQLLAEQEEEDDPTHCEVCGQTDREDRMLLCDDCDNGLVWVTKPRCQGLSTGDRLWAVKEFSEFKSFVRGFGQTNIDPPFNCPLACEVGNSVPVIDSYVYLQTVVHTGLPHQDIFVSTVYE